MTLPPAGTGRRRPEHPDPAPDDAVRAVDLDLLRRLPARRPVHLLDRLDALLDRPAVPDPRLGRHVPGLRLEPVLREGPHPALPGRRSGARSREAGTDLGAHDYRRAGRPSGLDRPTPRTQRPLEPPRETTLT